METFDYKYHHRHHDNQNQQQQQLNQTNQTNQTNQLNRNKRKRKRIGATRMFVREARDIVANEILEYHRHHRHQRCRMSTMEVTQLSDSGSGMRGNCNDNGHGNQNITPAEMYGRDEDGDGDGVRDGVEKEDGDGDIDRSTEKMIGEGESPRSDDKDMLIVRSKSSFRIMGRVINIDIVPPPLRPSALSTTSASTTTSTRTSSSSSCRGLDENGNGRACFTIDDGTACMEVIYFFSQDLSVEAGAEGGEEEEKGGTGEREGVFLDQKLNRSYEVSIGDCIDCVGKLQLMDTIGIGEGDDEDHQYKYQFQMVADSYSNVTDPNLETLRMVELSSSTRTRAIIDHPFYHYYKRYTNQSKDSKSTKEILNIDNDNTISAKHSHLHDQDDYNNHTYAVNGGKDNGIYLYGDLISKLAPFRREKIVPKPKPQPPLSSSSSSSCGLKLKLNNASKSLYLQRIERFHRLGQVGNQQNQKLIVNHDHVLNLIEHSKPDGLFESDLVLLLDCETGEEIEALKKGLEEMRTNYDIYISKSGSYLPL